MAECSSSVSEALGADPYHGKTKTIQIVFVTPNALLDFPDLILILT